MAVLLSAYFLARWVGTGVYVADVLDSIGGSSTDTESLDSPCESNSFLAARTGRSVIVGLGKNQSYQWFVSNKQGVLILKASVVRLFGMSA